MAQMANKHMQDAQHLPLSEKCKSKLQGDITSYQSVWPSSKKSISNTCWRGCGVKGTLLHCWQECKLIYPLWRTVWRFLKKLGIKLSYDPTICYSAFILRKPQLKKTHVPKGSLQHCLQQLGHGSNLDAHQQTNG